MSIHLLYRQETRSHSIRFGRKSCRLCWQIALYKKAKKVQARLSEIFSIVSWSLDFQQPASFSSLTFRWKKGTKLYFNIGPTHLALINVKGPMEMSLMSSMMMSRKNRWVGPISPGLGMMSSKNRWVGPIFYLHGLAYFGFQLIAIYIQQSGSSPILNTTYICSRHNKQMIWPFGLYIVLLWGILHNIFLGKQIMSTLGDERDVIWVGVILFFWYVNLFTSLQN